MDLRLTFYVFKLRNRQVFLLGWEFDWGTRIHSKILKENILISCVLICLRMWFRLFACITSEKYLEAEKFHCWQQNRIHRLLHIDSFISNSQILISRVQYIFADKVQYIFEEWSEMIVGSHQNRSIDLGAWKSIDFLSDASIFKIEAMWSTIIG